MRLSLLESFCRIVELRRLSEAAKSLHLSQPAVSLQLKELESHFGVQLVWRTTSGIRPTPAGEVVYEYAKSILALTTSLRQELTHLESGEVLKVASSTSVGNYALPCSIYAFKERHPGAAITLKVANSTEVITAVITNAADIGLVEGPLQKHPDLVTKGIAHDQLLLVVAPSWSGPEQVDLGGFGSLPLIMPVPGSGVRETVEASLRAADYDPSSLKVVLEMDNIEAIKSAVAAGHGVSILSRLAVKRELHAGILKALRVDQVSFAHRLSITYHKRRPRTPLAKEFHSFISTPSERSFC